MKKKLVVLSVDSLFDEDMELLKTLPNFGRLIRRGCVVRGGMRSVYPSDTYPAHASLITGTWPDRHGIYHNQPLDVGNLDPDWFWYRRDMKTETLLDAAHRAGYSTACVSWPCMGGDPSVDWLVPEIWPKDPNEDPRPIFRTACSANLLGPGGILERHWHKLRGTQKPFMDHMMIGCACDIIRRYKPDVMLIHLAYLDGTRHLHGVHGPAVRQAVYANDDWFGRLEEATMDAGVYENTNFAVISDHGHLNVRRIFHPNVLLAEAGLISLDENGQVVGWRAYCHSAGLSCQVFLREPSDRGTRAVLEDLLYAMRENEAWGVESVLTKAEVRREHRLDGPFDYVLEGKGGTAFGSEWTGPALTSSGETPGASHGHLPYKGPQPVWIAAGPGFKPGEMVSRRRIIDVAPTFAALLGITLAETEGTAMTELLK